MKYLPIIIVIGLALALVGCKSLANWTTDQEQGARNFVTGAGAVLAPATGGTSVPIALVVTNVMSVIFGINRWWVGRKRAKAIVEIDGKEGTPSAAEQVPAGALRKAVRDVTG